MSYTGMPWSQAYSVRIAEFACKCEFRNRNGGLHRALLGWVVEGVWKQLCDYRRRVREEFGGGIGEKVGKPYNADPIARMSNIGDFEKTEATEVTPD